MKLLLFTTSLFICSVTVAQGTSSATDATQQEIAALNAQAARDNAAAAAVTASTAKVQAQMKALGIPNIDGKTTLGTNAGVLETWMLSGYSVDAAGKEIARKVRDSLKAPAAVVDANANAGVARTPTARVLLLAGDEVLTLDSAANVRGQIGLVASKLMNAMSFCETRGTTNPPSRVVPLAAIGAIAGLLKTDTEIIGIDAAIPSRMLAAATGQHLRPDFTVIIPSAAVATPEGGRTAGDWNTLVEERAKARDCRAKYPGDKQPDPIKENLKVLNASIADADALEAKLLKHDEKGVTPLGQAIRVEALLGETPPYVLRVAVEKGGGTLLKRTNVLTVFGAPAVSISGGLVSRFEFTNPTTGELLAGGNLICRTAKTNIRDVQNSKAKRVGKEPDCKSSF